MLRGFLSGDKDAESKSADSKNSSSSDAGGADSGNGGKNGSGGKGGSSSEQRREEDAKRETRLREEPAVRTPETDERRHRDRYSAKLREAALADTPENQMRRSAAAGGGVSYEGLMRPAGRVMPLDPQSGGPEFHEALVLSSNRMVQNMQIGTKWSLGNPQQSSWEFSLGTHGFSDSTSVAYTTGGRWALMHQRVFRNGSFGMMQFIMQPPMGGGMMPPNTMVAMLLYPWAPHGGTTQFQYVMGQQAQISHAARIVRGLDIGAQLTYEFMTNATSLSYAFHSQSADKSRNWCGSYTPETGAWKLALTKNDWHSDLECGAQLELSDKRGQLVPAFSLGIRKPLFGGGQVHAMLTNFHRLKAYVDMPFGGDRLGMNQVNFKWLVQYDAAVGGAKHGVTIGF